MSDTFPVVFYFAFVYEDETVETYAFNGTVHADVVDEIREMVDENFGWYQDLLEDMEGNYGIHNWCSGPNDQVLCLGAYSTYEVKKEDAIVLMNEWRQNFLWESPLGFVLSKVKKIENDCGNDLDYYNNVGMA